MLAGVKVLDPSQYNSPEAGTEAATAELKSTLEGLAAHLFGSGIEVLPTLLAETQCLRELACVCTARNEGHALVRISQNRLLISFACIGVTVC